MRLLYITNGINGSGGLERVLSIKASILADKYGYEVFIISLNDNHLHPFYSFSEKIQMLSIPVEGNPLKYTFMYRNGIKNTVTKVNPDIILVCDDGLKAFFVPKIISSTIPILYERHVSKEIECNSNASSIKKAFVNMKWKLMEKLASSFTTFIVLTEGNKKEWKGLKNIVVIPNPLSFYPEASSTLLNKKVIAVGKQSYQKGYDRLLEAWKIVHENYPNWQLEIYGTIASEFKLEQKAIALNIKKSVSFHVPNKNIESKYLEASVYVLSSRFEGFGMVLIEAMACGVPCVAFDCNYGPSDIIKNEEDGFVVQNGNCEALANHIIKLIADEKLRIQMGKMAKENVKRFLPEKVVREWDVLFKKVT